MKTILGTRIDEEIPGDDGWWDTDNGTTFCDAGRQLQKLGVMNDDEIFELLSRLYHAAASEFGD